MTIDDDEAACRWKFWYLKSTIPVPSSERFHHTPVISEDLKNTTVVEGGKVNLTCRVTSELHPHFVWIKHYQINGSYQDENGTAYYRRLNPATQVLIRTQLKFALRNATCYLSLLPFFFIQEELSARQIPRNAKHQIYQLFPPFLNRFSKRNKNQRPSQRRTRVARIHR